MASIPIAATYQFGILPAIDGYTALMISFAPALLPIGIAMAIPKYTSIGTALALGFSVQLAIQPNYSADMATFLNSSTAVVVGFTVGLAVTRQIRAIGEHPARPLGARRVDFPVRKIGQVPPGRPEQPARRGLLDRVGLLLPRMSHAPLSDVELQTADALRDLRTGINLIDLQQIPARLTQRGRETMVRVLKGIARHYRDFLKGRRHTVSPALLSDIDELIGDIIVMGSGPDRFKGLAAIVGVRRDLYPDAAPYGPSPLKDTA